MKGDPQTDPLAALDAAVAAEQKDRRDGLDSDDWTPPPSAPWPDPLSDVAYHGVAGDFVHLVKPETEADPAALMFQFLAAAGNCFGDKAWFTVEETRHYPNLFELIAGNTSKARKGTSLRWIFRVLREAAPEWEAECVTSGLSTGEGLIERVRDPVYEKDKKTGQAELVDPGAKDKRLLIQEEEFSRPIHAMGRHDNTLAAVLRQAWDGNRLRILTRNKPIKASGAIISVIAQITIAELVEELSELQAVNGFANRFLFAAVKRSHLLPLGGNVDAAALSQIAERLREAIKNGPAGQIRFNPVARDRWFAIYPKLTAAQPGLFGAITARSEAQAIRLALVYSLLDQQELINVAHLDAALEIVRYANASVRHIFSDFTGNRTADTILRALRHAAPDGMTRTEISNNLFGRNIKSDDIGAALTLLQDANMIRPERRALNGGGRPAELWYAR